MVMGFAIVGAPIVCGLVFQVFGAVGVSLGEKIVDSTLQYLFDLLPASWRPYVVLLLLVLYVITKWRSNQKTNFILSNPPLNPEFPGCTWLSKSIAKPIGIFNKILNFVC